MHIYHLDEEVDRFYKVLAEANVHEQELRFSEPGFHASGLIASLYFASGQAARGGFRVEVDDYARMAFEMGWVWEDVLGAIYARRHFARDTDGPKPISLGRLKKQGISYTVDGFDTEDPTVYESKATLKSKGKHDIAEEWRWLTQMKVYCHALRVYNARLLVFYPAGTYKPPRAEIAIYSITFTKSECQAAWDMLLKEKARLEALGYDRV